MKKIKTYGELLEEIERTKEAIKQIKEGLFYEQGDEFDLELYLIHLEETKEYNEKLYEFKEKYDLNRCKECGSEKFKVFEYYEVKTLEYVCSLICDECKNRHIVKIDKNCLKENINLFFKGGLFA